jgi:hypothetical protein
MVGEKRKKKLNAGSSTNYVSEKCIWVTKLDHEQITDTLRKKYMFIIISM